MAHQIRNFSLLFSWGKNNNSLLGIPSLKEVAIPTRVPLPASVKHIQSVSFGIVHSALLTKSGSVYVVGSNLYKQLGLGENSPSDITTYTKIPGIPKMKAIASGEKHMLALSSKGELYSWGKGNTLFNVGALGRVGKGDCSSPTPIPHKKRFKSISAGRRHSLALSEDGQVYSWGNSEYGCLGTVSMKSFLFNGIKTPEQIDYFMDKKIDRILSSDYINAALTLDGKLFMWGRNDRYQLGTSNVNIDIQSCKNVPFHLDKDFEGKDLMVASICLSSQKCIATNDQNEFYQWGTLFLLPTKMEFDLGRIRSVAIKKDSAFAVTQNGRLFCWAHKKDLFQKTSLTPSKVDSFKGKAVSKIFTSDEQVAVVVD